MNIKPWFVAIGIGIAIEIFAGALCWRGFGCAGVLFLAFGAAFSFIGLVAWDDQQ